MKRLNKVFSVSSVFSVFSVFFVGIALTSCVDEVGDVFESDGGPSADYRINKQMREFREVLLSAENGWVIEYYGAPESYSYGGYNIIVKFNADSTATALSEQMYKNSNGSRAAAVKSHFKIEQSGGCILSFDEYNSVIHYFSNPVNPDGLGEKGIGFDGDLEFRILTSTKDEITMTGKKHGAKIHMHPLAAGQDWWGYFDTVKSVESEMVFSSYNLYLGGDTITVTPDNRSFIFSYKEFNAEVDSLEEVARQICYIVTPEGIKLYKSFSIERDSVEADTVTGFKFIEDADFYPTFNDSTSRLVPALPSLSEQLFNADKTWYITYSNMGEYGQAKWDIAKALIDDAKETMTAASLKMQSSKPCIVFTSRDKKKKTYTFGFYVTTKQYGDNLIRLSLDAIENKKSCYGEGYYYYTPGQDSYQGYDQIVDPFAKPLADGGRTFILSTDRLKKPTYIKMVDENDPTNVITVLSKKPDETPFES